MNLSEQVLSALKVRAGQWISGETLSEGMNVSRTAVWKQIKALQALGYIVESSPKKGYRLISVPDLLLPAEVCSDLPTGIFGRKAYYYFKELDSTNVKARELAAQGAPEGSVIVAEAQDGGKGRRGRTWYSPPNKGLYFSLILRPRLPLRELSRISLIPALAVAETARELFDLPALIKWPNDILVEGKKLAGILSEAVTDMDSIEFVVVGIGLNLFNLPEEFPNDFRYPATSVLCEHGRIISRTEVLRCLLEKFEDHYQSLLQGQFPKILDRIKPLLHTLGREVGVETHHGILTGTAVDIDENGFLQVAGPDGRLHTVMSGEIDPV